MKRNSRKKIVIMILINYINIITYIRYKVQQKLIYIYNDNNLYLKLHMRVIVTIIFRRNK